MNAKQSQYLLLYTDSVVTVSRCIELETFIHLYQNVEDQSGTYTLQSWCSINIYIIH